MRGDGDAVELTAEEIAAGNEAGQAPDARGGRSADGELGTLAHRAGGEDVALRNPESFRMFVEDEEIVVRIEATEEDDSVVGITVVHGGEPFDAARLVEVIDDMNVVTEVIEELAGGD